ncbi:MAG TPA: hypothetical protein VF450_20155 [Noviherbaspirillum sp.]
MIARTNTRQINPRGQHIHVFPALADRKGHISNLWFFHSPKNNQRFEIHGDVAFMHCILMEGDPSIVSYVPHPDPVPALVGGQLQEIRFGAYICHTDGRVIAIDFERRGGAAASRKTESASRIAVRQQAAKAIDREYRVLSDQDLQHKEILFDNWLNLCAIINRCRGQALHHETDVLRESLSRHDNVRLGTLFETQNVDRAIMLAVVAAALQHDTIQTELHTAFLGPHSVLYRRTK